MTEENKFLEELEKKVVDMYNYCGGIANPCKNIGNFEAVASVINFITDFFLERTKKRKEAEK